MNALAKQTFPASMFEVIIVNNDPQDLIPEEITSNLNAHFKIINEYKSGSYAARNAGIRIAKGNILGFTDSDCLPAEDWIENAVRIFEQTDVDRIAGHIEVFYEKSIVPTLAELYEKVFAFKQEEVVKTRNAAVTGNMFAKRAVFDKVGLFDEILYSGGDYEWGERAFADGCSITYGGDVIIHHPARKTVKELLKKARRVGGGSGNTFSGNKSAAMKDYILLFKPDSFAVRMIKNYGKGLSFIQKSKVFFLRFYIRHILKFEKLKVSLGKQASRT